MTKKDIIDAITPTTGLMKKDVESVVNGVVAHIVDSLSSGENVYLRGFGTFKIATRAAKPARDIGKNTTIMLPSCKVVKFIISPELEKEVGRLEV